MLTLATAVGTLTVIMGILVKFIGFPDQVLKIHRRKSTEGISSTFFTMAFLSYFCWTLHGVLQRDWVVIIGQGTGMITSGVIVGQLLYYRGQSTPSSVM